MSADLFTSAELERVADALRYDVCGVPDAWERLRTRAEFTLTLRWTCATCGWTFDCDAPGFAGDGRFHYIHPGNTKCGPISAQKVRTNLSPTEGMRTSAA